MLGWMLGRNETPVSFLSMAELRRIQERQLGRMTMQLETTELKPRIGSLIRIGLDGLLSRAFAEQIRALLEERGVLLIRGIELSDEQQLAITRTLGRIGDADAGTIYKVSFDKRENPTHADYNYGNFSWHIDRTDTDVPPFATLLTPKRLATSGGETEFANTYAAYEDLPEADKRLIDGLKVVHKLESSYRESVPNPTEAQLATWRAHADKVHPLVWRHRSGRRSLITSMSGTEVVGMPKPEGAALLARLMAWATQPEYVYVHAWRLGDIVLWNNTGTMHRARRYDITCGRLMHRTVVLGDEPFDTDSAPRAA
jgi:alpha-ketoglutarate-dependent taurine dioxygenase